MTSHVLGVLHCAGIADVGDDADRSELDDVAAIREATAEVDLLAVHEVALVEPSDVVQRGTADGEGCADDPVDDAGTIVRPRAEETLAQARGPSDHELESGLAEKRIGERREREGAVFQRAVRASKGRAQERDLGVVVHALPDGAEQSRFDHRVAVQDHHDRRAGGPHALVRRGPVTPVLRVGEDRRPGHVGEAGDGVVAGSVVDDDHGTSAGRDRGTGAVDHEVGCPVAHDHHVDVDVIACTGIGWFETPQAGTPPSRIGATRFARMSLSEDEPSGQVSSFHGRSPSLAAAAIEGLSVADWTLLRPESGLGAEGDLDVLVRAADLTDVVTSMVSRGFVRMPHGDPADAHLVGHDPAMATFLWVHVQTRVRAPRLALDTDTLLRSAHRPDGALVPVLGDGWLFWVLVVHTIGEHGAVPDRHRSALRTTAVAGAGVVEEVRHRLDDIGIDADIVVDCAARGDWPALEQAACDLPAPVPLVERLRGRLVALRRVRSRRGLSVAVVGPDGAGKSTLVQGLEGSLPVRTSTAYMGLTGGRMPLADRLRLPGLVFLTRVAISWVRYLSIVIARTGGDVVLVDRYAFDGRVPSGVRLGPVRRRTRRLEASMVPGPDLLVVLDAPGSVMFERKGEYDASTLETWRRAYRRIAADVEDSVVLDATEPATVVLGQAQRHVWRCLEQRWRG